MQLLLPLQQVEQVTISPLGLMYVCDEQAAYTAVADAAKINAAMMRFIIFPSVRLGIYLLR